MTANASLRALALIAMCAHAAFAQAPVRVVTLPPATAKSSQKFQAITGVRMAPDGSVLVNNARGRQITMFDSTLTKWTVVVDSADGAENSYGMMPSKLVPYLGDSSLFADANSQTLLVRDAKGKVVRAIAPPPSLMFGLIHGSMLVGPGGTDGKGRLIFGGGTGAGDSGVILRADFSTRRIDTVGQFKNRDGGRQVMDTTDPGKLKVTLTVNPLPSLDSWAVLSDGTVAIVRGHDYHIDWIFPDGSRKSSSKMPFDWRRLTDEDKQHLIDSSKAARAALDAARGGGGAGGGGGGGGADGGGARGGGGGGRSGDPTAGPPRKIEVETQYLALKDIADYYPPLRPGGVMPDCDGNVWILPTTSAQSLGGELVYDVVNTNGDLFERVRLPAGRSLAGFGRGGVVYLAVGDRMNGFYLERTRLPGGAARAR